MAKIIYFELNQKMIMGGHKAVSDDDCQFRWAVSSPTMEKKAPIFWPEEDSSTIYTAIVKMVVMIGNEFGFSQEYSPWVV